MTNAGGEEGKLRKRMGGMRWVLHLSCSLRVKVIMVEGTPAAANILASCSTGVAPLEGKRGKDGREKRL